MPNLWSRGRLVRNMGNPQLGPGRVLGIDDNERIHVQVLWSGARFVQNAHHPALEPYLLSGGVVVRHRRDAEAPRPGLVLARSVSDLNSPQTYTVYVKHASDDWRREQLPETELEPLPPKRTDPVSQLKNLTWRGPKSFLRRWQMHLLESRWMEESGGIPVLLGARIRPMAHQVYAARRVLWDRAARFVLADEVGLGKTIEAGLVLQSLLARQPGLRFLVIAPGAMSRQWQTELYLRFGGIACRHLDAAGLDKMNNAARFASLDSSRLIVATSALQQHPSLHDRLSAMDWDLVIIDEAHQFPPGTSLYDLFHTLARRATALLALSATPSKREILSLSGLLALVAPEQYRPDDHATIERRLADQREIWDRLSFTLKFIDAALDEDGLKQEDLEYLAGEWRGLLDNDPTVTELLGLLEKGDATAAERLLAYVQEHHRLDHRIIRTRRATLEAGRRHWSERRLEVLHYDEDRDEALLANHLAELPAARLPAQLALRALYQRMFATTPRRLADFLERRLQYLRRGLAGSSIDDALSQFTADPGPADEALLVHRVVASTPELDGEESWLDSALGLALDWAEAAPVPARLRALIEHLRPLLVGVPDSQVLIFAQPRDLVEEMQEALSDRLSGVPVRAFHHGLPDSELSRVALDFQRKRNCRVLVSDELGGEGRNFQNADLVVHFDLPWSVARLEQRIGRLDRVGRGGDRPVCSLVACGPTAYEQELLDVHTQAFRVFERSVGGLEYALPRLQAELDRAIAEGPGTVGNLRDDLRGRVERELADVDEAFALSLDASRLHLEEASTLTEHLAEPTDRQDDGVIVAKWAKKLGMTTHRRADLSWEIKWGADSLARPVPELPEQGLIDGTFDHDEALANEGLQLLGPGHPLVSALFADLQRSSDGRTTFMALDLGRRNRGRLFALVLGCCHADEARLEGIECPPGLWVRSQRHYWREVEEVLVELRPGEGPCAKPVKDAELIHALHQPDSLGDNCSIIKPNDFVTGADALEVWEALEDAVKLAIVQLHGRREEKVQRAASALARDLAPEIGFLRLKLARQPTESIQQQIQVRERLPDTVRHEVITPEAIAVILAA